MIPTVEQIEAARTRNGGYTKAQLAEWGVPWPPPKGWKRNLVALANGEPQRRPRPLPEKLPWNVVRCKHCDERIIWAITTNDKLMPVDADPAPFPHGSVRLVREGRIVRAYTLTRTERVLALECGPLRVSHYATCKRPQ